MAELHTCSFVGMAAALALSWQDDVGATPTPVREQSEISHLSEDFCLVKACRPCMVVPFAGAFRNRNALQCVWRSGGILNTQA